MVRRRIWTGLVALCTILALVAAVGAFGSSLSQAKPMTAVAASRHWTMPASLPPSQVMSFIPPGRTAIRVPILEYHYIRTVTTRSDFLGFRLSVTPTDFTAQMDWLVVHGYHPVTLDDVRAYFEGRSSLPARPVVLTFDDGYQDFWNVAEPILLAHDFKAVTYIVPGFWGQSAYMTPQEIVALDQSGMVEIASHTMNHVNLATASPANRLYQLDVSKSTLERVIGHPVLDFCYPSGRYNPAAVAAVSTAGYETATTEIPGTTLTWATRLLWPRMYVMGGETLTAFVNGLGTPEPAVSVLLAPSPETTPPSGAF